MLESKNLPQRAASDEGFGRRDVILRLTAEDVKDAEQ